MELVDKRDLGSRAERRWGSNPHTCTSGRNALDDPCGLGRAHRVAVLSCMRVGGSYSGWRTSSSV